MTIPNAGQYALILDHNIAQGSWSVLTPHEGVIRLYAGRRSNTAALGRGNLISYMHAPTGHTRRMDTLELQAIPTCWAHADIHFLHHVLEILLFFVPAYQDCHDIFSWCLQLYSNDQIEARDTCHARILFLLHLMYSIGMYPDTVDITLVNAWCIMQRDQALSRDALYNLVKCTNPLDYRHMVRWLLSCIYEHPSVHTLKTISYLKVLDHENYWCPSNSCW
jgi:hypothetical protein